MKRRFLLAVLWAMTFAPSAQAVEFTAKGEWLFGMGYVDSALITRQGGRKTATSTDDKFAAMQRLRLRLTAVASESLSGVLWFEIGDTTWGQAASGGALGTDSPMIEVKNAFLEWAPPNTPLTTRMGIQTLRPPSVAGGLAVLPRDVAGIVSTYRFNDTIALTGAWIRPFNDNFAGRPEGSAEGYAPANYLDNADLFGLFVPVSLEGFTITPWALGGMLGKNYSGAISSDVNGRFRPLNNLSIGTLPYDFMRAAPNARNLNSRNTAYSPVVLMGLPMKLTAFDPWNFEMDINYGYAGGFGRYDSPDYKNGGHARGDSRRQGWLIKALLEYKVDWGTLGIFGWYGSGDDGDVKNGSERMPTMAPTGNMTSFMGDGPLGWSVFSGGNLGYDLSLSYSGTWAIGAQIKDVSFYNNISHTLRAVWWGGTNSPSMVRHLGPATSVNAYAPNWSAEGIYLTRNDGLLEVNFDTTWQIYDNLSMIVELGYLGNAVDKGTWDRSWLGAAGRFSKADGYKAAVIFNYSF